MQEPPPLGRLPAPVTPLAAASPPQLVSAVSRILGTPESEPWSILGLSDSPEMREVQSAKRNLMLLLHPDKLTVEKKEQAGGKEKCKQAFARVQAAAEKLEARLKRGSAMQNGGLFQRAPRYPGAGAPVAPLRPGAAAAPPAPRGGAPPPQAPSQRKQRMLSPQPPPPPDWDETSERPRLGLYEWRSGTLVPVQAFSTRPVKNFQFRRIRNID